MILIQTMSWGHSRLRFCNFKVTLNTTSHNTDSREMKRNFCFLLFHVRLSFINIKHLSLCKRSLERAVGFCNLSNSPLLIYTIDHWITKFELRWSNYMQIFFNKYVNVYFLPYDFHNNVFFSYFIVRIQYIILYKIGVDQLFILSAKLLVNNGLSVVKFGEVKSYT